MNGKDAVWLVSLVLSGIALILFDAKVGLQNLAVFVARYW